jgi:hypothetical protein
VGNKLSHAILSLACKLNLRLSVKDRQLRKKLTPDYQVGCKRLVMSGTFYEAMQRPNTPIGNFSVIAMSEVQVPYVIQLIERWRDGEYDEVVCTQNALERFNKHLKGAMGNTVWTSGGQSWYLDADGDPLSWPFSWQQWSRKWRRRTWQILRQRTMSLWSLEMRSQPIKRPLNRSRVWGQGEPSFPCSVITLTNRK